MSSSDGNTVAAIGSVRVASQTTRVGGTASPAETAELAGRFTAMLESLNGVAAHTANDATEDAGTTVPELASSSSSDRPVALGVVSLLALNEIGDGGRASVAASATPDKAISARWLATLQNDAAVDGKDVAAD